MTEKLPFCECGCGEPVTRKGNRFINGHNKGNLEHTGYTYVSKADREIVICKNCHKEVRGYENEYIDMFIMLMN